MDSTTVLLVDNDIDSDSHQHDMLSSASRLIAFVQLFTIEDTTSPINFLSSAQESVEGSL